MAGLWESARLIFRALEKEDVETFLVELASDSEALVGAAPILPVPQSKKDAVEFHEFLTKRNMLNAVICLPAPAAASPASASPDEDKDKDKDKDKEKDDSKPKPIPIGLLNLTGLEPNQFQHRFTEIGINIAKEYQGQGYGTEAINWALDFAFRRAGVHRVEIGAFASNEGAVRLYERMGFKLEGRIRETHFVDGKFWDIMRLGMLEDEWRERRKAVVEGR